MHILSGSVDLANDVHILALDSEEVFEEDSADSCDAVVVWVRLVFSLVDQSLIRLREIQNSNISKVRIVQESNSQKAFVLAKLHD